MFMYVAGFGVSENRNDNRPLFVHMSLKRIMIHLYSELQINKWNKNAKATKSDILRENAYNCT